MKGKLTSSVVIASEDFSRRTESCGCCRWTLLGGRKIGGWWMTGDATCRLRDGNPSQTNFSVGWIAGGTQLLHYDASTCRRNCSRRRLVHYWGRIEAHSNFAHFTKKPKKPLRQFAKQYTSCRFNEISWEFQAIGFKRSLLK